jgi:hypothetical protein
METKRAKSIKRTITLVKEDFPFKFYLDNSPFPKYRNYKRILMLFPKSRRSEIRKFCIEQVNKNIALINLAEELVAYPIDKSALNFNPESKLFYQSSTYISRRVLIEDTIDKVIACINNIITNLEQNKSSVIFSEKYQCSVYLGNSYQTDVIHKYNEKIYVDRSKFSMTFTFEVLEVVSLILKSEDELFLLHEVILPEMFSNQSYCIQEVKAYPCIISFKKLKQNLYMIVSQGD